MGCEALTAAFAPVKPAYRDGKEMTCLCITISQESKKHLREGKQCSCPAVDSMVSYNAHLSDARLNRLLQGHAVLALRLPSLCQQ